MQEERVSLKRMQHLTTYLWFLVLTKTLLASSDSGPGSSNKVALYNKQNGEGGGRWNLELSSL